MTDHSSISRLDSALDDRSGPQWVVLPGKCNAVKRHNAGLCRRPAGWGSDHAGVGCCKLHGGSTPGQRKGAQRVILNGRIGEALTEAGIALSSNAGDNLKALESVIWRDQRMVWVLEREVAALQSFEREWGGPDVDGRSVELTVAMLRQWNDDLARHSKLGIDAGIDLRMEERNLAIDTLYAQAFAAGIAAVVAGLAVRAVAEAGADPGVIEALFTERLPVLIGEAMEVASGRLGGEGQG